MALCALCQYVFLYKCVCVRVRVCVCVCAQASATVEVDLEKAEKLQVHRHDFLASLITDIKPVSYGLLPNFSPTYSGQSLKAQCRDNSSRSKETSEASVLTLQFK